jgi:UDP-GlcNAc:undecaprenyl-phosphate/decaprenyl-phosphate GlcNAc-1-phosphate transferase
VGADSLFAIAIGFLLALTFSLFMVPKVRAYAIASGHLDTPDERKLHQTPVPRLGGIGIFVSFMLTFLLVALVSQRIPVTSSLLGILVGSTLMFTLGVMDDLKNLSPYIKLAVQFLAAIVAFLLGVQISVLDLPGSKLLVLHALSFPITLLWLVGISNAMNFIDGVDGLAGGVTTLSAVTLSLVAIFTHQSTEALLAAILAGASLGFLVHNFHPAKIFMGDSGALFSGFMLSSLAVTGVLKSQVVVMLLPVLVLSVPLMDITFSTMRRLFLGKNPFLPDADHLHHRLLKAGLSPMKTAYAFYAICFVAGLLATGYVHYLIPYVLLMAGIFLLMFLLLLVFRRDRSKPVE